MKENLRLKMNDAMRTFRQSAKKPTRSDDEGISAWISDNFYILEHYAKQAAEECKHANKLLKGSDLLPSLFMHCKEMCKSGVLPKEDDIIAFFQDSGLNGIASGYLPLAVTCALTDIVADGIKSGGKSGLKMISNAITSLRQTSEIDFEFITEKLCMAEPALIADPAKIYPSMDSESKSRYRYMIAVKAKASGKTEKDFAQEILLKAKQNGEHIGKYIFSSRKSKRNGFLFLTMEIVMPLAVSVSASILFSKPALGFLLFFPIWELMRYPIESVSMKRTNPKRFLRLSADDERVLNAHTLITVSTIMPAAEKMPKLEKHLEQIYLSNCVGNIKVCCLADFKGASTPKMPEDSIMIKAAKDAVDRLNRKYAGGFIFAVRPRVYSKTQNEFIGKERKRGAITELIRAVKGNSKGFSLIYGDTENLNKVNYLIALDADTQLVFDSARDLVSIAEHPLNRPVIKNGKVVNGYGILVPKTENRIESRNRTLFADLMSGDTGITAYDSLSCERYQDLFGEGIFSGKGLINVDAYYSLLNSGFPDETVLSHDIVESGYLRAAFVPDVQITDAFPKTAGSYYSRLHRWVRGDWQNILFIFKKNPLNFVSRYKMFDNLRRSLTPFLCLISLIVSLFIEENAGAALAVVSISALASRNLSAGIVSLLNSGFSALTRLYYSGVLPISMSAFVRAFISVAYSARESYVCFDAACKAMWRLFISKKKLLEWTTAAQSEGGKTTVELLLSCIPAVTVSVLFLSVGLPIHRLFGLILLADIPLTLFGGARTKTRRKRITEKQRETLLSYASAMWSFFDEQCGRANNFLPPDNIQFSPVRAIATRTSPTNIGLMLAAFLVARDFGFITTDELYMRLNLSLSTIEKLEKYQGNLLNWYDTVTLQPLLPHFVSTVDSGNFLCCLVALKEGLKEYIAECSVLSEIILKIETLINKTDLTPLYNQRRKLFHIGLDAKSGEKSRSYYDLYMSEARMTAYFAVASKTVPKKHWGALGRIMVGQGRYTGLASWTGTMFEYFMPNIFIPAPEGSLSKESLYFCIQSQRRRAGKKPFGISESGFYAFDGALNYQYKAHGVQKLGLKRGLDEDFVISPYSSFLTLTTAPQISLKNLLRLEKLGMTGNYGFFEAADFTKGRNSGDFSVVCSYMAHHVGMSFLSVANLLKDECMQRRFMSDSSMRGAKSLLEEKISNGATLFKDVRTEEIPHFRERVQGKNIVSELPTPFSPQAAIFSNGRMTTCITDAGAGISLFDGVDVTVNSGDIFNRPQGVFAVFSCEKGRIPFVSAIDRGSGAKFKAEFFKNRTEHTADIGNLKLKMLTTLRKQQNCEMRRFIIENADRKNTVKGNLFVYFDPCLEKREAYSAHPAFSKLFLIDEWDEENKCFIFSRRARDSSAVCSLAAGFAEDMDLSCESDRERVLTTPKGVFSIGEKSDFKGRRGNPDCCCAFSIEIELKPKESKAYNLIIAVEETKEQAVNTLLVVRSGKGEKKRAENPFYSDSLENALANKVLPKVLYPKTEALATKLDAKCNFSREDLWSFGVSGDLPIILVKIKNQDEADAVLPYIRINKILRSCSIACDLIVSFDKEEGYFSPTATAVKNLLLKEGCSLMLGVKGGVHLADLSAHSYEQVCALEANAVFYVHSDKKPEFKEKEHFKPLKTVLRISSLNSEEKSKNVKQYNFTEGKICIDKMPSTVDIPWSMIYANQSFGTMVSDKALGFTWALNSRENKLTPWYNDTMSDNRGELLIMKYNGILYDIASIGKAEFTPHKASWKATVEGIEVEIAISIPKRGMVKKCSVKAVNNSGGTRDFDLMYYVLPVLGVTHEKRGMFFAQKTENGAVFHSADSECPGFSVLICSEKADYVCFSEKKFFEGNFNGNESLVVDVSCVAVGRKISLAAGGKVTFEFFFSWGATENAAMIMPFISDYDEIMLNPVSVATEDKNLNLFFNSFLYSQVKQSRFYAKTGFYQCSGAYGFRDQLQDCLSFIDFEPEITLRHIYRCAAVQFKEGDVLHWWHVLVDKKQKIRGVRTRCSDDMLWLPYVCIVCRLKTGESDFLKTKIPYIDGDRLKKDERERYISPQRTDFKESLLMHCIRAVDYSLKFGQNGFPLIGSCDWNDGFSNLGGSESGESVWLAMFQKIVLEGMSDICRDFGMNDKAREYQLIAKRIAQTVENKAWTGDRFRRVVMADGVFLGEEKDFIDILPQAFAIFSGIGNDGKSNIALETTLYSLFDEKSSVIRLLSPPFDEDERENVGYIASYPAGIRENSGQYTHAAVWLAMALFASGKVEEGNKLISAINPVSFYSNQDKALRYRGEPYVLAGDVYFADEIIGRAGWTHFTGSASWFFSCICEKEEKDGAYSAECTLISANKRCKPKDLDTSHKSDKKQQKAPKNPLI